MFPKFCLCLIITYNHVWLFIKLLSSTYVQILTQNKSHLLHNFSSVLILQTYEYDFLMALFSLFTKSQHSKASLNVFLSFLMI